METEKEIAPGPEMTAAIEAGLRSAENEPLYTVDEVRETLRQWPQRSA